MIRANPNNPRKILGIAMLAIALLGFVRTALAVDPTNVINYQGRLLNANAVPVADLSLDFQFRFFDASGGGTCLWSNDSSTCASDADMSVALTDGLFSVNLGDTGAGFAAIPDSVFANNADVFLEVEVEGEVMSPRKRVGAAAYALNAQTLDGIDSSAFATSANAFFQDGNSFGATATLGTNDTFDLRFETDGSTRMTLDTSGEVGINTLTPAARLDIDGGPGDDLILARTSGTPVFSVNFLGTTTIAGSVFGADGTAVQPGYTFASSSNNGMFLPTAGEIAFSTSSSERLRIDSGGQIGINTTTPDAFLDIEAAQDTERIRLTDTSNADSAGIYVGSGDPNGALSAQAGSLFLDEIGTTWVNTNGGTAWADLASTGGGGGDDLDSVYDADANKTLTVDNAAGLIFDLTTAGDFEVRTGGTVFATFTDAGNVVFDNNVTLGAGTSDDIAVNGQFTTSLIPDTDGTLDLGSDALRWGDLFLDGGTLHIGDSGDDSDISFIPASDLLTFQNSADSVTAFQFLDADGGTPILNVDGTNERVGIGTASPTTKLAVVSTTTDLIEMFVSGTANAAAVAAANTTDGNFLQIGAHGSTEGGTQFGASTNGMTELTLVPTAGGVAAVGTANATPLLFGTDDLERMRILSTGNVGVGDTTPDALLDVGGSFQFDGTGVFGDAAGDSITFNGGTWSLTNDVAVSLGGGPNGINFDANTLSIDASTNRVGIGTASPDAFLDVEAAEDTERVRLTDTTNADSTGIYTGSGSPDGTLSAQAGSIFLDESGSFYVNVDGATNWDAVAFTGSGTDTLDTVYDNDSDKIMLVDNAAGLEFESSVAGNIMVDLQSTGDFVVQDAGSTFVSFLDTGFTNFTTNVGFNTATPDADLDVESTEDTERIRLTDTTNTDSVGVYTGTGTPNGTLSAQAGSLFMDQSGTTYVNTDGGTTWVDLAASGGADTFESVYANDGDNTLTAGDADGFTIDLTGTGDFNIEDAGSVFASFTDTGAYSFTLDATDNPAYTITNAGTSNVITNLTAGGDFVVQDAGVTYATFDDAGNVTFTNDFGVGAAASAETLANTGFTPNGDDAFVAGTLGVESTIFTDSGLTVGASTTYADGSITASGTLTIDSSGTVQLGTDDDFLPQLGAGSADIGASGTRWDNVFGVNGDFSGTLTAADVSCTDCLDFTEFADAMSTDATTSISLPSNLTFTSGVGNFTYNSASSGVFQIQDDGANVFATASNGAITVTQDATDNPAFTVTNNGSGNDIVNLASTGDFVVQDAGVAFFTLSDTRTADFTSNVAAGNVFALTDTSLSTGSLLTNTTTNNSASSTAWAANVFAPTNGQGTTATTTTGLDVRFTQSPTIAGNTENAARIQNQVTTNTTDTTVSNLLLLDNADTSATGSTVVDSALKVTVSGAIANGVTNAIDVSDSNILNALSVGANVITGTSATIDFTNFDVDLTGGITTESNLTVNGNTATFDSDVSMTPGVLQDVTISKTYTSSVGLTQSSLGMTVNAPAFGSVGTSTVNGLLFTPTIANATAGTNTANIINIDNFTGDAEYTTNAIRIGNFTGTAATERAINIGTGWDAALTVGGTTIIDGSGNVSATDFACTDCLDFDSFEDTLNLDAATTVTLGTNAFNINLDSTGDFNVQDAGVSFMTISDTGTYAYTLDSSDTYTVTNGSTGNIVTNLTSTGDFVIQDGGVTFMTIGDAQDYTFSSNNTTTTVFEFNVDDATTQRAFEIQAFDTTTGDILYLETTSDLITSADVFEINHDSDYVTTASLSGSTIEANRLIDADASGNVTDSGIAYAFTRTNFANASGTMTITGTMFSVSDLSLNAGGTYTNSSDVAHFSNLSTSNTGVVMNIANAGTGDGLRVNTTSSFTTTDAFVVQADGDVGVGNNSPVARLDVIGQSSATVALFDRQTTDGTIIGLLQAGTQEGSISVSGTTVSYNAFTGSHYATAATPIETGRLVRMTGTNDHLGGNATREIVYGVEETSAENQPDTLGAMLDLQESDEAFSDENPYLIAAVGNGDLWVVDEGEDIAAGDYLISSTTVGHARKDPGTHPVAYTVARAGEAIDWSTVSDMIGGKKHAKISVLFDASTRYAMEADGTMTSMNTDFAMNSTGTADATTQGYGSKALLFRGSGWDGGAAQDVSMSLVTDVTDATDYRLSIKNTSGTTTAFVNDDGDLAIAGKFYPSSMGTLQTDKYVYYGGVSDDYIRTNASGFGTGSYDFAEMFPSSQPLEAGDVVVFDAMNEHVRKSASANETKLAGIVSTKPGFLAGTKEPNTYPIALAGRVPTKVSTENGTIEIGDPLTSSSTQGVAMKATAPGMIVGYALEPLTNGTGTVIAFVSVGYWSGTETQPMAGTDNSVSGFSTSGGNATFRTLTMEGDIVMQGNKIVNVGQITGLMDAWSITEDGTIKTEATLKTVIESYQGEMVETAAVTSTDTVITLVGTGTLEDGSAAIRFEDVSPSFNDVISTTGAVRVVVTPNGPVSLYVSEKDHDGFTVQEVGGMDSGITFDWMVTAYRKEFEPAPVVETPPAEEIPPAEPPAETPPIEEPAPVEETAPPADEAAPPPLEELPTDVVTPPAEETPPPAEEQAPPPAEEIPPEDVPAP